MQVASRRSRTLPSSTCMLFHLPQTVQTCQHRGRQARTGTPELVWGPGKTPAQIAAILGELATRQHTAMATRIDAECAAAVQQLLPESKYNPVARTLTYRDPACSLPKTRLPGTVAVVAAGTSDLAVVEEVKAVAELMGCYTFKCEHTCWVSADTMLGLVCMAPHVAILRITDCGVAGLHRVLSKLDSLRSADVVIVAAGMDGALPSVLSGLVAAPVVCPMLQCFAASTTHVHRLLCRQAWGMVWRFRVWRRC